MRSQQVVNSFSSGVLSPRLSLRSDSPKYPSALQECINFIVSPQGGITMREGFKRFSETSSPATENRLFAFHLGGTVSDILVDITTDNLVHYRIDGTLVASDDSKNAHQYLQSEFADLYFTNRQKTGVICHKSHPPLYIKQDYLGEITTYGLISTQVPLVHFHDGKSPSRPSNIGPREWTLAFTGTWTQGDPYSITYGEKGAMIGGELVNFPMGLFYFSTEAKNIEEIEFILKKNYFLDSPETTVVVTATDLNNYVITITGKNNTYRMTASPTSNPAITGQDVETNSTFDALEDATEPAWSYPFVIELIETPGDDLLHYYQCIQPHQADADSHPVTGIDKALYWVDLGIVKPDWYDWQGTMPWVDAAYYSPWDRGFPTVAVFFQQRLLLMGSPDAGTGVWGSRIGDFEYFHLGPQDNDALYFDIDTSDSPEIKWAAAQRQLIIGTSSGDYTVSSAVTLAPSDISALKQNAARSHHTSSITINTDVFYVEQGKEKVRATSYIDDILAQSSKDISLISEHLLRPRIKRIVLMQTPEVVIFCLRENGTLACISYTAEQDQGSWYEFNSQGYIEDIAVGYSALTDEDELWATVNYNGIHYIEKMPYPNRDLTARINTSDQTLIEQGIVCMDGWTTGDIVQGDNNVISGLEQYEGLVIGSMVNDAWTGEYTVTDGNIILEAPDIDDNYVGTYAVGFIYAVRSKTFEMSGGNQRGSAFGSKRRWNKLYVRLLDSALPLVNGTLPSDRTAETIMGIPEIIRQGQQDVVIRNTGWGDGSVIIEQKLPYPTHILGLYGEYSANNA